jgi:hypothetical protein
MCTTCTTCLTAMYHTTPHAPCATAPHPHTPALRPLHPDLPHVPSTAGSGPTKVFHFSQKVPIPTYLLALAVGELVSRQVGPRSRVWSEPAMVEAGAYEFAETAKFLDAGGWCGA